MDDSTTITMEDRACLNCTQYKAAWGIFNFLHVALELNNSHQCQEASRQLYDPVLGKKVIFPVYVSARYNRSGEGKCGNIGDKWTPSPKWKKKKENLFKLLAKQKEQNENEN